MVKPKILIVFFAGNAATEALALVIADGARAAGATVRLRRTRNGSDAESANYDTPAAEDAAWADAILFGTPKLFGSIPLDLSIYLDTLDDMRSPVVLNGKFGGVFGAPAAHRDGARSTVLSLYDRLVALGLIIVPLGYSHLASARALSSAFPTTKTAPWPYARAAGSLPSPSKLSQSPSLSERPKPVVLQ